MTPYGAGYKRLVYITDDELAALRFAASHMDDVLETDDPRRFALHSVVNKADKLRGEKGESHGRE